MDVTITGRNVGIPDRFEEYVTEKTDKVEHLAPRALRHRFSGRDRLGVRPTVRVSVRDRRPKRFLIRPIGARS